MASILLNDDGSIRDEVIVGWLALVTVQKGAYSREAVVNTFEHLGLDTAYIPHGATAVDAFNKACTGQTMTYISPTRSSIKLELRSFPSEQSPERIARRVVRHETAVQRRAVNLTTVGEVVFYKAPRSGPQRRINNAAARLRLQVIPDESVHPGEWQTIAAFIEQIKRKYEAFNEELDDNAIRKLAREYIRNRLHGVQIQHGSYFAPHAWADELGRLRTAIESNEGCSMELFPIMDLPDQRATVQRAFERDTEQPMQNLAMRLRKVLQTRVSVAVYQRLQNEFDSLVERTKTYADVLHNPSVTSSSAIDVATALLHDVRDLALASRKETAQ